jgi:hypothetical protein
MRTSGALDHPNAIAKYFRPITERPTAESFD